MNRNRKNPTLISSTFQKIVFFLFLLAGGLTHANDVSKGLYYYDNNQYKTAYHYFTRPSAINNAQVQRNLGWMYSTGSGVKKDYVKAMEWFSKSAAQGNTSAQFDIGTLYENGEGVKQDYQKAAEWYQRAALKEYSKAQNNLGLFYEKGLVFNRITSKPENIIKKLSNKAMSVLWSI